MCSVSDVPAGALVKMPNDSYERGAILVKTNVQETFPALDGRFLTRYLFIVIYSEEEHPGSFYWLESKEEVLGFCHYPDIYEV